MYNRFNGYNNSNAVTNVTDRLAVRPDRPFPPRLHFDGENPLELLALVFI